MTKAWQMQSSFNLARTLLAAAALMLGSCSQTPGQGPVVLAASSMQEAMEAVADAWEGGGHRRPVLSFSSSPSVARLVNEGAPADIAITADAEWMDWLEEQDNILAGSRRDIAGNSMVFVWQDMHLALPAQAVLPEVAYQARVIAMADPATVPAGRYARQALEAAGLWADLADKVVPTENVRVALALVGQGEADLGIVYASDVRTTPDLLSSPLPLPAGVVIRYPAALTSASDHDDAEAFLAFLSGPEARLLLCDSGFKAMPEQAPC